MTNKTPDGGAAFPNIQNDIDCGGAGMSLRDYFAAHATEGDIAEYLSGFSKTVRPREAAKYRYADAMLKARGEPK